MGVIAHVVHGNERDLAVGGSSAGNPAGSDEFSEAGGKNVDKVGQSHDRRLSDDQSLPHGVGRVTGFTNVPVVDDSLTVPEDMPLLEEPLKVAVIRWPKNVAVT